MHNWRACAMLTHMTTAKLISAKDKAAELGISRATLSRRVSAGEIKPAYEGDAKNGVQLFTPSPDALLREDGVA